ncbi:hypothetical protein [Salipiger thiooxidans]|uniref:hypothetical protein n=1 Tax=Salipiger thiooxidans TaxID=282683 RepID=UPI001CD77B34|nr:hypothetical protein [Salipiger thiooxidans]MCA0848789.1 hypothetical protein [Salipiger thiooxidans]
MPSPAGATLLHMVLASGTSITTELILALAADRALKLSPLARNVFTWPKAVASALIGGSSSSS